jgi:hypothetical protein
MSLASAVVAPGTSRRPASTFRQGLGATGYEVGRNVVVEYRWPDGNYDNLPSLAADSVRRNVAVIATINTPSILAAQGATRTIPIVFAVTGVNPAQHRDGSKAGAVAHKLAPSATLIALLVNPTSPAYDQSGGTSKLSAARNATMGAPTLTRRPERDGRQAKDAFVGGVLLAFWASGPCLCRFSLLGVEPLTGFLEGALRVNMKTRPVSSLADPYPPTAALLPGDKPTVPIFFKSAHEGECIAHFGPRKGCQIQTETLTRFHLPSVQRRSRAPRPADAHDGLIVHHFQICRKGN